MTGAPSLTCPECGTDARTTTRLHRRRRYPRRLIVVVLLCLALWYSLAVRRRITWRAESVSSAVIPTTALLLYVGYGSDGATAPALSSRLFAPSSERVPPLLIPRPQRWLAAQMLFRQSLKLQTPRMVIPKDMEAFLQMAEQDTTAADLWMRMAAEHADLDTRRFALSAIHNDNAAVLNLADIQAARRRLFEAWRADRLRAHDIETFVGAYPRQKLSDADVLDDIATAVRAFNPAVQQACLAEAIRRRLTAAIPLIEEADRAHAGYVELRMMYWNARARLRGEPDPCTIRIARHEDSKSELEVFVQISAEFREVLAASLAGQPILRANVAVFIVPSAPRVNAGFVDLVDIAVPPTTRPTVCGAGKATPAPIRAAMLAAPSATLERLDQLLPVSNELRLSNGPE